MHGLTDYAKEGRPVAWDISLENSADSYLCFWLTLFHSVSYFIFLCRSLFFLTQFLILFHHLLPLETLTPIIRTGLPILVELIDLVNSVIIFQSQMALVRWLTFLLRSQTVILVVLLFWIYFLPSGVSISDHVVFSVSIEFPSNVQQGALFYCIAYDYSHADREIFVIIWEMFYGRISLNSVLLLLPVNFVSGFKHNSSPWFSAACAAFIVHRNHFFHLYQRDKSSDSKVKFRRASNCYKWFLKLPKMHMLIKQGVHYFPGTWLLGLLANF